jgi:hypothetical protein
MLIDTEIMPSYAHEQKAHMMGVQLIGVANKTQFLRRSWALPIIPSIMKQVFRRF